MRTDHTHGLEEDRSSKYQILQQQAACWVAAGQQVGKELVLIQELVEADQSVSAVQEQPEIVVGCMHLSLDAGYKLFEPRPQHLAVSLRNC